MAPRESAQGVYVLTCFASRGICSLGDGRRSAYGRCWPGIASLWSSSAPCGGQRRLTGTLNVLDDYRGIPALKIWNAPLVD